MADAMKRHPKQIHVRMSEEEILRTKKLAAALGITPSDLARGRVQVQKEDLEFGESDGCQKRASAESSRCSSSMQA